MLDRLLAQQVAEKCARGGETSLDTLRGKAAPVAQGSKGADVLAVQPAPVAYAIVTTKLEERLEVALIMLAGQFG